MLGTEVLVFEVLGSESAEGKINGKNVVLIICIKNGELPLLRLLR